MDPSKFKKLFRNLICMAVTVFLGLEIFKDTTGMDMFQPIFKTASDTICLKPPSKLKCVPRWQLSIEGSFNYIKRTSYDEEPLCKECLDDTWIGKERARSSRSFQNGSLLYCNIPKCASSFLSQLFKTISNSENNNIAKDLLKQDSVPRAYSFMFVRNPYMRLFSAYENKLFSPGQWWLGMGKQIISEERYNASLVSKRLGHDVSFREFIRFVLNSHEHDANVINTHVAPQHTLCNPCGKKFEFIGKLETMTTDLKHLINELKSKNIISNETRSVAEIELETRYMQLFERVGHMFWAVESYNHLLSVYKLFHRTWASYQIRGLILNKFKMPFSRLDVNTTKRVYKQAVDKAVNASKIQRTALIKQRNEALVQAYRTVPITDMIKLRRYVQTDCILFGYDDKPDLLFERNVSKNFSGHDYFEWL